MFSNLSVSSDFQNLTALPEVCQPSRIDVSRLVVTAIKNLKNLTIDKDNIDKDNYYTSNRIIDIIITLPEEIQNSIFALNGETFESIKNSIRMENPYIKIKKRITVVDYFVFNLYRKGVNSNETINEKSLYEKFHITRDIWVKNITTHLENIDRKLDKYRYSSWLSFEKIEKEDFLIEFFKDLEKINLEMVNALKKEENSSLNINAISSNFSLLTIGSSEKKRKKTEAFESSKSTVSGIQEQEETSNPKKKRKKAEAIDSYKSFLGEQLAKNIEVKELTKNINEIDEKFFWGLARIFIKDLSYIFQKNSGEVILSKILTIMWSMNRDAFINKILKHTYFVKNEKLEKTLPLLLKLQDLLLNLEVPDEFK